MTEQHLSEEDMRKLDLARASRIGQEVEDAANTRLSPEVDLAEFVSDYYRMLKDNGELDRWRKTSDRTIAEAYCERAFEGASDAEHRREVELYVTQIAYYRS